MGVGIDVVSFTLMFLLISSTLTVDILVKLRSRLIEADALQGRVQVQMWPTIQKA